MRRGFFQWNGSSVLAGDVTTGRKEKLSNEIGYIAGADIGVTQKFTLAADILGIQPLDTSLGAQLSPPVRQAVATVARKLAGAFCCSANDR